MVLAQRQPGDPPLPVELQDALREWTVFAAAVTRTGRPDEVELVRRRGRQLASRVADALGRPVDFVDPVTGDTESIRVGVTGPIRVGATGPIQRVAPEPPGPTPWATGLAISAFFAVLVAMADITLCRSLAGMFGLVWIPANLLAGLGLAPSLFVLRRTPFWRWPVLGVAAGLGVAWVVLLLGLLGPR